MAAAINLMAQQRKAMHQRMADMQSQMMQQMQDMMKGMMKPDQEKHPADKPAPAGEKHNHQH